MRTKQLCECCGVGVAVTTVEIGLLTLKACRLCSDPDGSKERGRCDRLSYQERLKEFG